MPPPLALDAAIFGGGAAGLWLLDEMVRRGAEAVVLLGNSLTLTPGTITVEVNSNEIIVHAIDDASGKDLIERRFERRIGQVFPPRKTAK